MKRVEEASDRELLMYLVRKVNKIDGHVAVLNDEHNNAVAWRADMNRWRGHVDATLRLVRWPGYIAAVSGVVKVLSDAARSMGLI